MPIQVIPLPSADELHALFDYDPETGALTWKERPPTTRANKVHNARDAGKQVGAVDSWGHRQVRVGGRLRAAHRVIWKMMTGKDPAEQIDHINGSQDDNRWCNLREATQEQNQWNTGIRVTNTSGHRCIYPMKTKRAWAKKWRVVIGGKGGQRFIGDFHTLNEAIAARDEELIARRDHAYFRKVT